MNSPVTLHCPEHQCSLVVNDSKDRYVCTSGWCEFPIVNAIPRFVSQDNYAASFGLQWNRFRTTQLDSFTGMSISKDRLTRLAGGSLDVFSGKNVLEAGCGAGRFTEVMLEAGANIFAVDISTAVEANHRNCEKYPNYFVCQADILELPVPPEQFDIVVCVGVVQHTPDPEETMTALCSYVRPGGLLIIDHYSYDYPITPSRRVLRSFLLKRSKTYSMRFCQVLAAVLWPVHRIVWITKDIPGIRSAGGRFLRYSPIVDYHYAHPQLGSKLLYRWAILDTHDTLTDHYKHLRSAEEIERHLGQCGMVEIETAYAGNGVEARARKPYE